MSHGLASRVPWSPCLLVGQVGGGTGGGQRNGVGECTLLPCVMVLNCIVDLFFEALVLETAACKCLEQQGEGTQQSTKHGDGRNKGDGGCVGKRPTGGQLSCSKSSLVRGANI